MYEPGHFQYTAAYKSKVLSPLISSNRFHKVVKKTLKKKYKRHSLTTIETPIEGYEEDVKNFKPLWEQDSLISESKQKKSFILRWLNVLIEFIKRVFIIILLLPGLLLTSQPRRSIRIEKVLYHQKVTTGLLEDLAIAILQFIDQIGRCCRLLIRLQISEAFSVLWDAIMLFKPSSFISSQGIDMRSVGDIIQQGKIIFYL